MLLSTRLAIYMTAALCTGAAFAQTSDAANESTSPESTPPPVAYIYVSNITNPSGSTYKNNVYAYAAAANGKLTLVSGSPFADNVFDMGVNGKYLFGGDGNGDIDSFLMTSTGALQKVATINPTTYNPGGCGNPGQFRIDHSGGYLYNVSEDPDCFGTHFQYFKINSSTGKLTYTGDTSELGVNIFEIDFLGNNNFGYAPICTEFDHEEVGYLTALKRNSSNGTLTEVAAGSQGPNPPQSGNSYCPVTLATDPTNHMAALMRDEDSDGTIYGKPVIATFTAGTSGALTTTSTYHNMPVVSTVGTNGGAWMRMSPSGKLLAVGGNGGLQIFHFNGASPLTTYKTLLSGQVVGEFLWDNDNHLYVNVYNPSHFGTGKLYVYTVTPTSVTEAPGSPYSIPNPYSMAVQPK